MVVIGAQKCGTTSLHQYLGLHPQVSMSSVKETNFFLGTSEWRRGFDWYSSLFDPDLPVRGEACPDYTDLPVSASVAPRLFAHAPGARLIYLVRGPDRPAAIAVHAHVRRRPGNPRAHSRSRRPGESVLSRSRYATQLRPFAELFGADQILVETQERLLTERADTMRRIFEFIGVDANFTSPEFERRWEQSAGKGPVYSLAYRLALRGVRVPSGLRWPVQRVLRGNRPKRERPDLDEGLRDELARRLRPEIDDLQAMTGLTFPSWTV